MPYLSIYDSNLEDHQSKWVGNQASTKCELPANLLLLYMYINVHGAQTKKFVYMSGFFDLNNLNNLNHCKIAK